MKPRPIIGITTDYDPVKATYNSYATYASSVEKAGGLPLLIPYHMNRSLIPQLLDTLAGILFSGGDDLDPSSFGQTYHKNAIPIDPARQQFEMALLAEVERRRMPTLGICLGSQLMNVYRGGSLHQFLPDLPRQPMLEHRKLNDVVPRHDVALQPGSHLAKLLNKTEINANSYHKQSIDQVGRGLRIIGTAPDGVIEGTEDPTLPLFLGVQWHPERLADEPDHLALFKLLVQKAAEQSAKSRA